LTRDVLELLIRDAVKGAVGVSGEFPFIGVIAGDDDAVPGPAADNRVLAAQVAAASVVAVGQQEASAVSVPWALQPNSRSLRPSPHLCGCRNCFLSRLTIR
jgi:hypothetical protein